MANPDLALAAEFPPATREMWLALVERVLKGAPFEKRLVSKTYGGISIEPLYSKAEPASQPMRGARGPWRIAQRLDHPDAAVANDLALADLTGGADTLSLVFARAPFGLRAEAAHAEAPRGRPDQRQVGQRSLIAGFGASKAVDSECRGRGKPARQGASQNRATIQPHEVQPSRIPAVALVASSGAPCRPNWTGGR